MANPVLRSAPRDDDGPVSGAIQAWTAVFSGALTSTAYKASLLLPAGMKIKVLGGSAYAAAVTSDPSLTIGWSGATTKLVAAVNLTTNLGALTIKSSPIIGQTGTATELRVTITNDTGDTFTNAQVSLVYYVMQAPTAAFVRGQGHF